MAGDSTALDGPSAIPPPLEQAMREVRRFSREKWLDLVRGDQSHRWRQGRKILVEDYFKELPELRGEIEEALVLITGELLLRRESGESPIVEEYQSRFPELGARIAVQFYVEALLSSQESADDLSVDGATYKLALRGYAFLEELGRGSVGVVYRAHQVSLGRSVAIKVFAIPGSDSKVLARQRQEAEILGRLHHPNVVHVYEACEIDGWLHLVMEYIDGKTLADRVRGRLPDPQESARMALTLAGAVHAVHEAGILHRDLKPSNVLVTADGDLKISDFGLAKYRANDSSLTTTDAVLGTPSYMAPEQATGNEGSVGPQADVYSLGAILYELLTGRAPFLGVTVLDTLSLISNQEPVAPRRLLPGVPKDLETICLVCLAKAPSQRYASAAALAKDLQRFLDGLPILARPPNIIERSRLYVQRHPVITALSVAVAILLNVAAMAIWANHKQHRQLSAAAVANAIVTADLQALPRLLERLDANHAALPLLSRELETTAPPDRKWVNLSIAVVATDASASGSELLSYLPIARPSELSILVQVLGLRSAAIRQEVWRVLLDESIGDDARLRLACLAARISPTDPRWAEVSGVVARSLVRQDPLDTGAFTTALTPVRETLTKPIASLFRDPDTGPVVKQVCAGILTRFAFDDPLTLVAIATEGDVGAFRRVLPALQPLASAVLPMLRRIVLGPVDFGRLASDPPHSTEHEVEYAYDAAQRQRAQAAVAMGRLGDPDSLLESLRSERDPACRAWLIELLAPLGYSTEELMRHAEETDDSGVRQALLLAIGGVKPLENQGTLVTSVQRLYRDDPDAGVHSACRWLLHNRLGAAASIDLDNPSNEAMTKPAQQWYVGPNSHSFTVFQRPQSFLMGSPSNELSREEDEAQHNVRIEHRFAVSIEEVTIGQFLRFQDKRFNRRFSSGDDCPANNVSWFEAAAYCRWLSEQAGLSEEEMCYPPLPEIHAGMTLPSNWLERSGYRLPLEVEWEFACRGGVDASRFCGEGEALRPRYAWFLENSDNVAHPVGQLMPNRFGVFDALGNVAERCHDEFAPYLGEKASITNGSLSQPQLTVESTSLRGMRGGNFGDMKQNVRSARRHTSGVLDQWALIGFRVARTVRP